MNKRKKKEKKPNLIGNKEQITLNRKSTKVIKISKSAKSIIIIRGLSVHSIKTYNRNSNGLEMPRSPK